MKCLNCGGTNLQPFSAFRGQYLEVDVHSYLCVDCGHVEFFASARARELVGEKLNLQKQMNTEIQAREEKIAELESTLEPLREQLNLFQEEVLKLRRASENENITVRQQKDLLAELEAAKQKMESIGLEVKDLEEQIECLKSEIRKIQKKMAESRGF